MINNAAFCDEGKCFAVETPRSARPLWNYFVNDEYHTKFSQTGQGTSYAFSPREKTITRDYRYFYIKVGDNCHNPNYLPLNVMPEKYRCEHRQA